jgi:hypothetical protein
MEALARVESGNKRQVMRFGKVGKSFYGPFNIHRDFGAHNRNPFINTITAVKSFQGMGSNKAKIRRRLRKYNASFDEGYYKAIMKLSEQLRVKSPG